MRGSRGTHEYINIAFHAASDVVSGGSWSAGHILPLCFVRNFIFGVFAHTFIRASMPKP